MRHRAPTVLSRLRDVTTHRRGLAAGAVAALGVSACVGLVAVDGHDFTDGTDGVTAGSFPGLRQGTTYPDAAALETMSSERSDRPTDRGDARDARTSPSDKVSEAAKPAPTRSEPSDSPEPAAPQSDGADEPDSGNDGGSQPRQSEQPEPSRSSQPSESPQPSETPEPEPEPTTPSPTPAPAPETTAVTDLSAAGTWTVVLSSDRATSFECSLDGGAWQPCGPVATFTGLSKGRHTLAVRAVDSAGTADPTPAQLSTNMSGGLL